MIRIIVRTDDAGMACNVGGAVETTFRTFELDIPALEAFLREPKAKDWQYTQRQAVGIELLSNPVEQK